jgi:hypothetical protein
MPRAIAERAFRPEDPNDDFAISAEALDTEYPPVGYPARRRRRRPGWTGIDDPVEPQAVLDGDQDRPQFGWLDI